MRMLAFAIMLLATMPLSGVKDTRDEAQILIDGTSAMSGIMPPFRPSDLRGFERRGPCVLHGQAFVQTRGGSVIKFAGQKIMIMPHSRYSQCWLTWFGDHPAEANAGRPALLTKLSHWTQADADGNFTFAGLAPGAYIVFGILSWEAGSDTQGGLTSETVIVVDSKAHVNLMPH